MKRAAFIGSSLAALSLPARAFAHTGLTARLRPALSSIPGSVGVYARTMAGGPPLFAYNARVSFPSASTIKTLIMLAAFRAAETRPAVMSARIRYDSADLIGGSDFLANAADGQLFTVHELIVPMIQVSDNTASNLLISYFGFPFINETIRHAGLRNTYLRRHFLDASAVVRHMDNRTTAQDMAHLMFEIERGSREELRTVASPASCRAMIRIMLGQTDRDTIPRLLPPGVPVANKTGELARSRSDVAIVDPFGDSPYVLAVYTDGLDSPEEAYQGIAQISRVIYGAVAQTYL